MNLINYYNNLLNILNVSENKNIAILPIIIKIKNLDIKYRTYNDYILL